MRWSITLALMMHSVFPQENKLKNILYKHQFFFWHFYFAILTEQHLVILHFRNKLSWFSRFKKAKNSWRQCVLSKPSFVIYFCSFISANLSSCTCRAKFMYSPLISWSNNSHVASSTCGRELKLIFDEFSVNSTTDVIERHLHLCSRQKKRTKWRDSDT